MSELLFERTIVSRGSLVEGADVHFYRKGEKILTGDIGWAILGNQTTPDKRVVSVALPVEIRFVKNDHMGVFIPAFQMTVGFYYDNPKSLLPLCRFVPTERRSHDFLKLDR